MVKVFISYRRADSAAIASRIYDSLVTAFGKANIFKDVDTIPGGHDFRTVITDWMTQSDVLLVVIGDQWLSLTDEDGQRRIDAAGDYVRYEIELGLRLSKVMVIPVVVGSARPSSSADLPESLHDLAYLNAVFVRDDHFEHDITHLIETLSGTRPRRSRFPLWAAVAGLLLIALVAGLLLMMPTASGASGELIFTRGNEGSREIYWHDVSSGQEKRLTNHTADDYSPRWSPDGKRVAFISTRTSATNIYIIDADGANLQQLTNGQEQITDIVWSPDSRRIAFTRRPVSGRSDIYVVNADGNNLTALTNDSGQQDRSPDWSPDGTQLVFIRGSEIDTVLHIINADGSEMRRVGSANPVYGQQPKWSPDGNTIVFSASSPTSNDIESIAVDGAEPTLLSPSYDALDSGQRWSPDGSYIAFLRIDRTVEEGFFGTNNLFRMDADGGNTQQLTTDDAEDYDPAWSPDGSQIAFTTERKGNQDIYAVSIDASNLRPLIDTPENEREPQWRPGTRS